MTVGLLDMIGKIMNNINCMICGKITEMITPAHLRMHGISMMEYKEHYPDAPIRASTPPKIPPTAEESVACLVCGKTTKQITPLHLKMHSMTMAEYRTKYPDAEIISVKTKELISKKKMGVARTQETKDKISATKADRGYDPASYSRVFSDETRKKISESRKAYYARIKKDLR